MAAVGVLRIDGDRALLPSSVFDHDGFRRWATSDDFPEGVRATFVRGEVLLEMSPESTESHNKAKLKVSEVVSRIVDEDDWGEAYADGVLLTHEEAGISTEPDLVFLTWATLEAGKVAFVPKAGRPAHDAIEIVGTPDLVVEILSDSSVRKDTSLLRDGYARALIPEYWLIDARRERISFVILTLRDGEYVGAAADGDAQPSAVLGRSFRLRREKNRVGRFRYALDVVRRP